VTGDGVEWLQPIPIPLPSLLPSLLLLTLPKRAEADSNELTLDEKMALNDEILML
jgi:hypothetical protein